jgi:hypothetical protein
MSELSNFETNVSASVLGPAAMRVGKYFQCLRGAIFLHSNKGYRIYCGYLMSSHEML